MVTERATSSGKLLLSYHSDGVVAITMHDPDRRNALDLESTVEFEAELDRFAANPDLKVLVITGTPPAFSSGFNVGFFADKLKEAEENSRDSSSDADALAETPWGQVDPVYTFRESGSYVPGPGPRLVTRLHNLQKPSIAAVNGHAYGVGCGIALSCDLRVAGRGAQFNEAYIRTGLVPADGSCWQLPKLIGMSRALWMQYSGESIDGDEAYRIGLANEVVPDDQVLEKALEMAHKLARGPVLAMGMMKHLVHQSYQQDFYAHLPIAARAHWVSRATADHKEGVAAFMEKRKPVFRGR